MSTTTSIWDDPELRTGGEYVRFDQPGDTITGKIVAQRTHRFDDGKLVPQIILDCGDEGERTLTAGQIRLKAELAALRPTNGDTLTVTLTQIERRAGGKELKHFDVSVNGASASAPDDADEAKKAAARKLLGL